MRSLLRACSKRKLSSLFFGYCDPSAKSTLFSVYGVVFNELWFDIQLINTGKETAEVTLNFTWAVRASLAWDNFFLLLRSYEDQHYWFVSFEFGKDLCISCFSYISCIESLTPILPVCVYDNFQWRDSCFWTEFHRWELAHDCWTYK